jgi:hypothetical protein
VIDLDVLKKANVVDVFAEQAKVVLSGELKKAVKLKGIGATKGAARCHRRPAAASRPDRPSRTRRRQWQTTRRRTRQPPSAMQHASARSAAACCS